MKKIHVLIAFLFPIILHAQILEPKQDTFSVFSEYQYISADSPTFKQNHTIRGWQWGGDRYLTEAMEMNQTAASGFRYPVGMPEAGSFGCNGYLVYVLYSKSFVFNFNHF